MMAPMDVATAFRRASDGFVQRAQLLRDEQWSASTPCTEWDVRALVNHLAGEYLWMAPLLAGQTIAEVGDRFDGDVLGDSPLQRLVDAQRQAVAAVQAPDALARTVHLSFGDTPASEYAMQMTVDSTIHAWDLARGMNGDDVLDPELVDLVYANMLENAESWRSGGAFGPETRPVDDSKQAKLIALTGR
jgi:uncharacterized protein (TIGR03086 family)